MKRLFLVNSSAVSRLYGIGSYVSIIFQLFKKDKIFKLIFVDFIRSEKEEYIEVSQISGAEVFCCHFNNRNLYNLPHHDLYNSLNEEYHITKNDVFHFNTPNHYHLADIIKTKHNVHLVYTMHFDSFQLGEEQELTVQRETLLLKICNRIICLSEPILQRCSDHFKLETCNLSLLKTGVFLKRRYSSDKKNGIRSSFNILEGDFVILFNSRIHAQKGIYELLKVLPMLLTEFPNLKLIVVGDGELSSALQLSLKCLGSIIFTGYIPRENKIIIDKLYQIADLFVLPSNNEQLSISFLEAASYALPILVADIPSFASFPENSVFKVPLDTHGKVKIETLKKRLTEIIKDKPTRDIYSHNILHFIKKRYSSKKFHKELLNIYVK